MSMDIESEPEVTKRGPGRPRKDDADPVIARAPVRTEVRERKRKHNNSTDKFAIPPEMIPPGVSVEWKAETVAGKPVDSWTQVELYENGWRPVDVSMMPDLMPQGYKGVIRQGGQVLMERPIELTREAEAEARENARAAVQAKEDQLRGAVGPFRDRTAGTARNTGISRTIEPGAIPE